MENIKYHHFLITRFNLKQNTWTTDKNKKPLASNYEPWLKKRFELFETYCLPSIQSQQNKNFKWLIYFDVDTPEEYREKISQYQILLPNFSPRFINGMAKLIESIKEDLKTLVDLHSSNNIIITSRLDNDDSLHEDFIDIIQKFVTKNNILLGAIDVINGYCLQIEPKKVLSSSIQFSNAFISYVEPFQLTKSPITVFGKQHGEWVYSTKTYFIRHPGLWTQIVHENNVSNKVQGKLINNESCLKSFNFQNKVRLWKYEKNKVNFNHYIQAPLYFLKKRIKLLWLRRRLVQNFFKPLDLQK